MARRMVLIALIVGQIGVIAPTAFAADNGTTSCDASSGTCTVTVTTSGSPGQSGGQPSGTGGGSASGSGSAGGGSDPSPTATLVNGACTYQTDPGYQPPTGAVTHAGEQGGWYLMTCPDGIVSGTNIATTTTSVVWLTTPPPATPAPPAPAVLAALAQKDLKLATPVIESSPRPGLPQLVSVPMWAWVPGGEYVSVSATASVPGESVTATATPVSVTWSWGDGTSTACPGAGTAYTASADPTSPSPTCGHTYAQSSGNGAFTLSATISWAVAWAGGGQSGAFNNMTTTATEAVRVEQSRALITGS